MTITEFLLARITEDEYEAHVCLAQYSRGEGGSSPRWRKQLAECAAKRAIIGDPAERGGVMYEANLLYLATVYADHPDYDPAWRT